MLVIGLTGGIGSGKSTVGALFAELGSPVIDADTVAREVVEPGSHGFAQVVAAFGPRTVAPDGTLDRRFLRAHVFADPERRRHLEALLHPLIKERIRARVAELSAPYCVVIVPLLLESGWQEMVDRIAVVDCPPELQIARATTRDGQSEQQVRAIMAAQAERSVRLAAADDIIDNSRGLEHLREQVQALHRAYLARAMS